MAEPDNRRSAHRSDTSRAVAFSDGALAILLTTSLLPFPTAVIAGAVEAGDPAQG